MNEFSKRPETDSHRAGLTFGAAGETSWRSILFGFMATLFLLTCFPQNTYSEIYQWVDENGITHFSNSPLKKGNRNVRVIREFKSGASVNTPGVNRVNTIQRSTNYKNAASGNIDKLIREKEDELARLKHRHRNQLTILRSDLGAKERDLETCTRFPLPEVNYGSRTYDRDRRHRNQLEQERYDARNAVRQARIAIEHENTRYENAKAQIENELWQLKSAKR